MWVLGSGFVSTLFPGDYTAACTPLVWQDGAVTCTAITCPNTLVLANAGVEWTSASNNNAGTCGAGNDLTFNGKCEASCGYDYYRASGDRTESNSCTSNGEAIAWTSATDLVCDAYQCTEPLTLPANASWKSTSNGGAGNCPDPLPRDRSCTLECNVGYHMSSGGPTGSSTGQGAAGTTVCDSCVEGTVGGYTLACGTIAWADGTPPAAPVCTPITCAHSLPALPSNAGWVSLGQEVGDTEETVLRIHTDFFIRGPPTSCCLLVHVMS